MNVAFYSINEKLYKILAKFVEKYQTDKNRVLIKTHDNITANDVNDHLWSYEPISFLPHALYMGTKTVDQSIQEKNNNRPIKELYENITERYMIHDDFSESFFREQQILVSSEFTNINNPSILILLYHEDVDSIMNYIKNSSFIRVNIFFSPHECRDMQFAETIWNAFRDFDRIYWSQRY
ncbi:DNA polymerase III subunit chi [Candidatus Gromoviella agglomerans]|uniref:DNA polymerase III subunit chi n=1 Tax=Candidatus Gromoviella agglomerans TaxID=2806609 RepID=UPI001E60AF5B|nr:DNA polymerase III subunit chi [Candidatus Gromoviella agglomerans]UFX98635.1 DNA polymerase III subunit chi domain-containing protein [Candidatus Gromoviella agglomerans]